MPPLYFNAESGELREVPRGEPETPSHTDGWRPLAELLVAREFPYTRGDFPRPKTQPWDDSRIRQVGSLIAEDLAQLDTQTVLAESIVSRLNVLGLFPSVAYFAASAGHYKGLVDFRHQIGADKINSIKHIKSNTERAIFNAEYAQLSIEEFTDLILKKYNDLIESPDGKLYDGPITLAMIDAMNRMGITPAWIFIKRRYGGLAELNEYLGFPDVRNWDETDYIQYGARFIRENGPDSLTEANLAKLCARRLGPNKSTVAAHFGSLSAFQNLAMAEYARQEELREARSVAIERHFEAIEYRYGIPDDPSERAKTWGRYLLAQLCLPKATKGYLRKLSRYHNGSFVETLLERRPDFSLADIENMAVSLQVADYIWPTVNQRSLKL